MKKIILLIILISMCSKINAYTEYKIGDIVTYNDIEFYVIQDSDNKEDSVTMLKAEPLSYEEIQKYAEGIDVQITNQNGYGLMKYSDNSSEYSTSFVKNTIDAWARDKITIYNEVRLISHDDLITNLGYINSKETSKTHPSSNGITPSWVYNSNYEYWTMTPYDDSPTRVWVIRKGGGLCDLDGLNCGTNYISAVRPVITLSKTALGDKDESLIDDKDVADNSNENIDIDIQKEDNSLTVIKDNNKQESIIKVNVANTYLKQSIIVIIMGFIIAGISVFIYYKVSNKKK